MRPLLFGSGKPRSVTSPLIVRGFNEAAAFRQRKTSSTSKEANNRRCFNEAAAFRQRKNRGTDRSDRDLHASMRPLLFGSGKGYTIADLMAHLELQ